MKKILFLCITSVAAMQAVAQSDPHYTMFMYNKLMYNPGYAGSREITEINGTYRDQWVGIEGAPKTINISADGLVGSYMNPDRKVALGISFNNETIGVETNTEIMTYYSYKIKLEKSSIAFGLSAGAKLYTANYSQLLPYQQADANLSHDIKGAFLPNFGTGIFWSSEKAYLGVSIPNLLQNYYDKNEMKLNNQQSREIRGYYASGGYAFTASEHIKVEPQFMFRYAGNATYKLPPNADFNLSCIYNNRLVIGATWRTDMSVEGIIHMQVFHKVNMGYAFDYSMNALGPYNSGTHEFVIGYDIIRDNNQYTDPRFIKAF